MIQYDDFMRALAERKKIVYEYLYREEFSSRFHPQHIRDAIYAYMDNGGKSLRPAALMFACGAVGGDERKAVPAAAAIEIFHTWTLVHDDIIDRDSKRRGGPTVHEAFRQRAIRDYGYNEEDAAHYGLSIAILAGDMQQGWAVSILTKLAEQEGMDPRIPLYLIKDAEMRVLSLLIDGEMRDVQFSKTNIHEVSEADVLDMLSKKTGVLYEFAGKAGAMIGLNTPDPDHPLAAAVSAFAADCGAAFQLQDDILGVVGDEEALGKPVGSDIREGKRTTIALQAYRNGNREQRGFLMSALGNPNADAEQLKKAADLMRELGGIEYTANLAKRYIERALERLEPLPPSEYRDLLHFWADYMIQRTF